ncbi:MAG: hypothetical protein AAF483_06500 [Planctomycetota bacterium]
MLGSSQSVALLSWDPELHREVVVKVYHDFDENHQHQAAFEEGRAWAKVRGAHVAHCYDAGLHDGVPYFVLEYVEGRR